MPVTARDFRLFSVQAALFTPGPAEQFRPPDVLAAILPGFSSRYDGKMQVIPSEPGAIPAEVARGRVRFAVALGVPGLILTSADQRWKLEGGPTRLDSHWFAKAEADFTLSLNDICQACIAPMLAWHKKNPQIQIGRLALVFRRWAPCDDPAQEIANQFCKPELTANQPLSHSQGFRLENLKRFASPSGYTVNSWVRCYSNVVSETNAISIEQDINTLSESATETSFEVTAIEQFFAWVPGEMQQILDFYFPR
jgi:hypothetical protein